jgi:hypothetical protein
MVNLPVRLAEAALNSGVVWRDIPCDCHGCQGSTSVSRMVSRRLAGHSMSWRAGELEALAGTPTEERLGALERMFDEALGKCETVAAALEQQDGQQPLPPGSYHYLEVLREAAGGPPATIPGDDSF